MKQFLCYILLFSTAFCYCQTQLACDRIADSSELVKFYQNFNGNQWSIHTNWLVPGKPINTWSGIVLNASGCVEEINLDSNKLNGILYDINLPNLRKLAVYSNRIRGSIPDFTKLTELNQLNLSQNELTGSIPNFFSLAKLIDLDLSNNSLTGNIQDFNRLLSLKTINFLNN